MSAQNPGGDRPVTKFHKLWGALSVLAVLSAVASGQRGPDRVATVSSYAGPNEHTMNRVYKKWPEIFNNDSTLTSAVLDRLLHHAETVTIDGKSYRMKDKIEE
jgi:hypothetical protein